MQVSFFTHSCRDIIQFLIMIYVNQNFTYCLVHQCYLHPYSTCYNYISFAGVFSEKYVVVSFLSLWMSKNIFISISFFTHLARFKILVKSPSQSILLILFIFIVTNGKSNGNLILIHLWITWISFLLSHQRSFRVPLIFLLILL